MNGKGSLVCTILMGGLAPGFLLNNNFLLFHANANNTLHYNARTIIQQSNKKSWSELSTELSTPKSLNASWPAA